MASYFHGQLTIFRFTIKAEVWLIDMMGSSAYHKIAESQYKTAAKIEICFIPVCLE